MSKLGKIDKSNRKKVFAIENLFVLQSLMSTKNFLQ